MKFSVAGLTEILRGNFGEHGELIPKLYWHVNRFSSTESLGLGSKPVAFTVNLVTPPIVCLLAESQDVRLSFRTCNVASHSTCQISQDLGALSEGLGTHQVTTYLPSETAFRLVR